MHLTARLTWGHITVPVQWDTYLRTLAPDEIPELLTRALTSGPGQVAFRSTLDDLPVLPATRAANTDCPADALALLTIHTPELLHWAEQHLSAHVRKRLLRTLATDRMYGHHLHLAQRVGELPISGSRLDISPERHPHTVTFNAGPHVLRARLAEEFSPQSLAPLYAEHGQAGLALLAELSAAGTTNLGDLLDVARSALA